VPSAERDQLLDHIIRRRRGTVMRAARPIVQPGDAVGVISVEPFVSGPSTNGVLLGQFRDREQATARVADELQAFFHG
jgi:hypothetical protein